MELCNSFEWFVYLLLRFSIYHLSLNIDVCDVASFSSFSKILAWQIEQKVHLINMVYASKENKSDWLFQQSHSACSSQLIEWLQ